MITRNAPEKKLGFTPGQLSRRLGGSYYRVGINWTYVSFETEKAVDEFIIGCTTNHYRTRNKHRLLQASGPDMWAVQFHHFPD
jgi:hypothetical protein